MTKTATLTTAVVGAELQELDFFVGRWHAEGTAFGAERPGDDPRMHGVPWVSDESYIWLPGGYFLQHHWHEHGTDTAFVGTEIIGFDPHRAKSPTGQRSVPVAGYFSHMFDNSGNHPCFDIHHEGNVWTYDGVAQRAIVTVQDRNTVTFNWEWKYNGEVWLPLCDRVARRVG